jgi:Uma2 family endonuclease
LAILLDESGHLTAAPELIFEALSAGTDNERWDRDLKVRLYSVRGVEEYWIANWRLQQIQVYRREQASLRLVATLLRNDELTWPLLPGFSSSAARIFA